MPRECYTDRARWGSARGQHRETGEAHARHHQPHELDAIRGGKCEGWACNSVETRVDG